MKLDFDLSELDLNELDFENMGAWPKAVKILFTVIAAIGVAIGSYFLLVDSKIDELSQAQEKEQELRNTYRVKFAASANLELYREQQKQMEDLLTSQLKRLPASHETPGLLDDITYVGTSSGLTFIGINWMPEVTKEFYTELPITIEVIGRYHEFGEFVSKVAELPRIVTLHDFKINQMPDGRLNLNIVAKTYRYRAPEEQAAEGGTQ